MSGLELDIGLEVEDLNFVGATYFVDAAPSYPINIRSTEIEIRPQDPSPPEKLAGLTADRCLQGVIALGVADGCCAHYVFCRPHGLPYDLGDLQYRSLKWLSDPPGVAGESKGVFGPRSGVSRIVSPTTRERGHRSEHEQGHRSEHEQGQHNTMEHSSPPVHGGGTMNIPGKGQVRCRYGSDE